MHKRKKLDGNLNLIRGFIKKCGSFFLKSNMADGISNTPYKANMTKQEYFHLLITGQLADELEEPNEFNFIRMLKEQERNRENGRRRKNNRNYPRGKRKAV